MSFTCALKHREMGTSIGELVLSMKVDLNQSNEDVVKKMQKFGNLSKLHFDYSVGIKQRNALVYRNYEQGNQ